MPTYEYECRKCGQVFDVFQSMNDAKLERCPECKGKVIRLFGTGSGIIFKGSGFYETDYRRAGSGNVDAKETGKTDTGATESAPVVKEQPKKDDAATAAKK